MTLVKINAIEVPEGAGPDLERRFAERAGEAKGAKGFLGYELLRPTRGRTYFSYTRWATEEDFRAFVSGAAEDVRTGEWKGRAASGATLLEFEAVTSSD
ncbi:MAG: antibiotic biosynthesis monooxygenase [Actinocatenispora sp.]